MVAGSVGMRLSSSGLELHSRKGYMGLDTIQPTSGWWMYETSKYPRTLGNFSSRRRLTLPVSEEEILEEKRKQYEKKREMYPQIYPEWKGKESLSWLE